MSDVMLMGVLRMPTNLWGDDCIDMAQRHSRYVQSADRIESDAAIIAAQAAQIERLRSAGQRLLDESQHCGEIQYCGDDAISPWEAFRAALKETT